MAARNRKGLSENTRERIQTSMIVNRLTDHILGTIEMNASQVSAALGLIKKTLPDLSAMELKAEVQHSDAKELTNDQLADIAATGSAGVIKQETSKGQSSKIH